MPLIPTSQRDRGMVAVGIFSLALAVVYFMYGYRPRAEELVKVATHVESLTAVNDKARAELAKGSVNELRAQARRYAANLELMRQLVPTGNEVPALLEQVSTAARRVGLDIASVEPLPLIPGDEFDTYRYRITMKGGYHALGAFLTNVGSLTRIIAPANVKLVPVPPSAATKANAKRGQAVLLSDFEMQTYVAKMAPAQPPRSARKGETKS